MAKKKKNEVGDYVLWTLIIFGSIIFGLIYVLSAPSSRAGVVAGVETMVR